MSQDDIDDYNLARLVFSLRKEDAFGTVMRAQMHIEHELRRFIQGRAASPNHTNLDESDFEKTVRLALIHGLNAETKPALTALATLRNKFARRPDMELGEQEANNFYNSLGPQLKSMIRETYAEFRVKENLVEFKRQSPIDRLIWFLIGVWSAVFADRKQDPKTWLGMTRVPREYVKDLRSRESAFFQLLEGDDDLGMVIRAHTHLEHELREFVLAAAPQPAEIKLSEYDYAGTLRLAMTLGLDPALGAVYLRE
jgi:hypothetical protein